MPNKKLTDTVVAKTKPPASGRLEYWDSLLPGFGLRITDKGARSLEQWPDLACKADESRYQVFRSPLTQDGRAHADRQIP